MLAWDDCWAWPDEELRHGFGAPRRDSELDGARGLACAYACRLRFRGLVGNRGRGRPRRAGRSLAAAPGGGPGAFPPPSSPRSTPRPSLAWCRRPPSHRRRREIARPQARRTWTRRLARRARRPVFPAGAARHIGHLAPCVRVAAAADSAGLLTIGEHDPWQTPTPVLGAAGLHYALPRPPRWRAPRAGGGAAAAGCATRGRGDRPGPALPPATHPAFGLSATDLSDELLAAPTAASRCRARGGLQPQPREPRWRRSFTHSVLQRPSDRYSSSLHCRHQGLPPTIGKESKCPLATSSCELLLVKSSRSSSSWSDLDPLHESSPTSSATMKCRWRKAFWSSFLVFIPS